jgi:hypothetical protein
LPDGDAEAAALAAVSTEALVANAGLEDELAGAEAVGEGARTSAVGEDSEVEEDASVGDTLEMEVTATISEEGATGVGACAEEEGELAIRAFDTGCSEAPANKSVWAPFMNPIAWLSV